MSFSVNSGASASSAPMATEGSITVNKKGTITPPAVGNAVLTKDELGGSGQGSFDAESPKPEKRKKKSRKKKKKGSPEKE